MHKCSIKKFALTVLLIFGQFFGTLHAAEYGGDLHFHNDIACVAILNEDEDDVTIAPLASLFPVVPWNAPYPSRVYKNPTPSNRSAWPPHTGPPLNT